MGTVIKIGNFEFLCKSAWDRIAFHHTVDAIYNSKLVGHSYCQYYNRTWECRTYQTAVLDALWDTEKQYKPNEWKYREERVNSPLKKDIDEARELAKSNYY